MTDTPKYQGLRKRMVEALRQKGISDPRVLQAMEAVPRHLFLDPSLAGMAYEDQALPIFCDQTISQPSTVAFQSQLLELQQGMKVLEIGTGSGYQTAVLCRMGAKVFTIERQKGLFDQTKQLLEREHYRAKCFLGDGYAGMTGKDYGPFDRIIVTCGAPTIPPALVEQLREGGLMVIPTGSEQLEMVRLKKTNGELQIEKFGHCRFVPMLEGKQF